MLASLLTNTTTPAIDYNNSTNISITNASFSTTTSRPEQDVDEGGISAEAIAGIVGMGAVAAILCRIGYYCWNKVCHRGKYYINEEGQEEDTSPPVEEESLLQSNSQSSTSASGGRVTSDSGNGANSSLQAVQVESPTQPAPSR